MDSLDLFSPIPAARRSDPETSHQAAESMRETAASQRIRIFQYLVANGPKTADELDDALELRPTSAGRRLPELWEAGKARPTAEKVPTRSGRLARKWEAET